MSDASENQANSSLKRVPRSAIVLAALFLALPAMIPFYFALDAEDSTLAILFGAFGMVVLIANGLMLALIVRWLTRYMLNDADDS